MRRPLRRVAAAAGALLMLLVACGDGGSVPDAIRQSVSAETTTTAAIAPSTTTTTAGAGRTTTTTRTGRTTTTRAGATPTTAASGSAALKPAAAGRYRYDTAGATTFGGTTTPLPAVTTLVVDAPAGSRQHSTRDLRDASGNGLATEFTLDYRPEGVFLLSLRLTTGFGAASDVRDLQPPSPVLLLATGARPGAHLDVDLTGTSTAKLAVDILREERVTIAGQAVDTLVMRAAVTLAPGEITGRQELTVNVDRVSRLWVKEHSVTDASALGGLVTLHGEYTATLQRLTP